MYKDTPQGPDRGSTEWWTHVTLDHICWWQREERRAREERAALERRQCEQRVQEALRAEYDRRQAWVRDAPERRKFLKLRPASFRHKCPRCADRALCKTTPIFGLAKSHMTRRVCQIHVSITCDACLRKFYLQPLVWNQWLSEWNTEYYETFPYNGFAQLPNPASKRSARKQSRKQIRDKS